jgi:hypothetical protein
MGTNFAENQRISFNPKGHPNVKVHPGFPNVNRIDDFLSSYSRMPKVLTEELNYAINFLSSAGG